MIRKIRVRVELSFHGRLKYIKSVNVKRSIGITGNICTIMFSSRLYRFSQSELEAEEVRVYGGYEREILIYIGYVEKCRQRGENFVISCRDDLGMLQGDNVNFFDISYSDVLLSELNKDYLSKEFSFTLLDDVKLGRIRYCSNYGETLRTLCETYGLKIFSRIEGEINKYYISLESRPEKRKEISAHILKSDKLKRSMWRSMNVMVTLTGINRENHVVKVSRSHGIAPFRQVRRVFYGHCDEGELTRICSNLLENELTGLQEGFSEQEFSIKGTLTTDGEHDVQIYDIVSIPTGRYLIGGSYEVTGNVITIDEKGYRQQLTLGKDISATEKNEED